jgi:hypothetical protein
MAAKMCKNVIEKQKNSNRVPFSNFLRFNFVNVLLGHRVQVLTHYNHSAFILKVNETIGPNLSMCWPEMTSAGFQNGS